MQQGGEARNLSSSVGPCRISFHFLNTLSGEAARLFPSGNRGHKRAGSPARGLSALPPGSLEPDASVRSLGRTSCLCTDQPRWGAHAGHPLEYTRASVGAHAGIRWSSRRHPLELCSNACCAFLWRHHGLGPAHGCARRCTRPPWWRVIVVVLTWQEAALSCAVELK